MEVEVGPLSDFSQLLVFQEAAESLPEVDGVRLERFSDGCATLSVNLREPTDLAAALQEAAPLPLQQRDATSASLAFDVPAAGTQAACLNLLDRVEVPLFGHALEAVRPPSASCTPTPRSGP